MTPELKNKLQRIRLFVTDFDGIHTDGHVYVDSHGNETVRCSRKDGLGYEMLKRAQIAAVISKEKNPVVEKRAEKLGIECFRGIHDSKGKIDILKELIEAKGLTQDQVLYMGDDLNDVECLKFPGVSVTVADGHESLKSIVTYTTQRKGGDHAIREVCELVLEAQGHPITF
jgi:3-deoxy-D-manno-octulosonate 8-phosphate phosphatase (KDO 8-P phosphatase)